MQLIHIKNVEIFSYILLPSDLINKPVLMYHQIRFFGMFHLTLMHQPAKHRQSGKNQTKIDTQKKNNTVLYQEGKARIVYLWLYRGIEATTYLLHRNNMARGKLVQQYA
jgi:hypothetical protein